MTTDADRVKPLEWEGSEARTPQGDLYTVRQLSRIVWVTSLNGTDCPGWSPTEALAKARAQAHYDNRAALAPAPQAADATHVHAWIVGSSDGARWRTWATGSPEWTKDREEATRFSRREDAEAVHREDEDAWRVVPYKDLPNDADEAYEIGVRDGYSDAVQEIDLLTGGDGEYRYCTDHDPDRHTPDPATMIRRIVDRLALATLAPAPQAADAKPVAWRWHWNGGDEPDVWAYRESEPKPSMIITVEPLYAAPQAASPVSPSDPATIIAGIRQFGLAADGADLRELEAAIDRSAPPVPEGWVLVPANADYELIERRFDTQDWEAEDYRDAQEEYARWLAAAQEGNGNV